MCSCSVSAVRFSARPSVTTKCHPVLTVSSKPAFSVETCLPLSWRPQHPNNRWNEENDFIHSSPTNIKQLIRCLLLSATSPPTMANAARLRLPPKPLLLAPPPSPLLLLPIPTTTPSTSPPTMANAARLRLPPKSLLLAPPPSPLLLLPIPTTTPSPSLKAAASAAGSRFPLKLLLNKFVMNLQRERRDPTTGGAAAQRVNQMPTFHQSFLIDQQSRAMAQHLLHLQRERRDPTTGGAAQRVNQMPTFHQSFLIDQQSRAMAQHLLHLQ